MKFIDKNGMRGGPWFETPRAVVEAFRKRPIPYVTRVSRDPNLNGRPLVLTRPINIAQPVPPPGAQRQTAAGAAIAGDASAPPAVSRGVRQERSSVQRIVSDGVQDLAVRAAVEGVAAAKAAPPFSAAAGPHQHKAGAAASGMLPRRRSNEPVYAVPEPLEETMLSQEGVEYAIPTPVSPASTPGGNVGGPNLYELPTP